MSETIEVARRVVETVLDDRSREGHFHDPEKLTHYLLGSYAPGSGRVDPSRIVADRVLEMIDDGADIDALIEYVDASMSAIRREAFGD